MSAAPLPLRVRYKRAAWLWIIPFMAAHETGSLLGRLRKASRKFHLWVWGYSLPPHEGEKP